MFWLGGLYEITRKFHEFVEYGQMSRLHRDAVSIPSKLAKGSGSITKKDQAHHTHIAYASVVEFMNQLIVVRNRKFLGEEHWARYQFQIRRTQ